MCLKSWMRVRSGRDARHRLGFQVWLDVQADIRFRVPISAGRQVRQAGHELVRELGKRLAAQVWVDVGTLSSLASSLGKKVVDGFLGGQADTPALAAYGS